MNYIKQGRAFDRYIQTHLKGISVRAIAAWHALFAVLNDRGWPDGAQAISKHELLARFPGSEETLRRATDELCTLGLIVMEAETRRSDARYTMAQLYAEEAERESCGENVDISADSPQVCRNFGADSAGFCGNSEEMKTDAGRVLSIDRARAHARPKQNQNVNVNENKKREDEEETRENPKGAQRLAAGDLENRRRVPSAWQSHVMGEPEGAQRLARAIPKDLPGVPSAWQSHVMGEDEEETRARRGVDAFGVGQRREDASAKDETAAGSRGRSVTEEETRAQSAGEASEPSGAGEAIILARACGFSNSKRERQRIAELARKYGTNWACAAIDRAALRGADKCNTGYVQAILSRWAAAGGMDEPDAYAGGKMNKNAGNAANSAGNTNKTDLYKTYSQRTYTKEEDEALFTDLFSQRAENAF